MAMSASRSILAVFALGCAPAAGDSAAAWGPVQVDTDAGAFSLDLDLTPDPPVAGEATLRIDAWDAQGDAVQPTLALTPWMPVHGHGVSEDPAYTDVDGGVEATFAWSMPGEWELRIEVSDGDVSDSVVVPVEVQ